MSEVKRLITKIIVEKTKNTILNETTKVIEKKFQNRIRDMELYARIFYASILSSYSRANSLGSNVGIVLPELTVITKALYAMSRTRSKKQGSFETTKAFDIANSLDLKYKIPMVAKNDVLTYKLTFTIRHPILVALEEGNVSWEGMEKNKIINILQGALRTLTSKIDQVQISKGKARPIHVEILKAIAQLKKGEFKIIKNKRPYMEIAVKNLVKEKDFIGILIK